MPLSRTFILEDNSWTRILLWSWKLLFSENFLDSVIIYIKLQFPDKLFYIIDLCALCKIQFVVCFKSENFLFIAIFHKIIIEWKSFIVGVVPKTHDMTFSCIQHHAIFVKPMTYYIKTCVNYSWSFSDYF